MGIIFIKITIFKQVCQNNNEKYEKNNYMITFFSFLIVLFGSVNWLSIGMLQYDIIAGFFGTQSNIFSRIFYIVFGFAAIWLVISAIRQKGKINIVKDRLNTKKMEEKEDELAEKFGQKPNPND